MVVCKKLLNFNCDAQTARPTAGISTATTTDPMAGWRFVEPANFYARYVGYKK